MANDNLKSILIADGEGIHHEDLTNLGKFTLARLLDGILEKLCVGPELGAAGGGSAGDSGTNVQFPGAHGDNAPTSEWAYALTSGGAYPRVGSDNGKIQIAPGTLFQKIAARDGNEATFLPYTFDGTDEVQIADGDAANPRVDLVQMQLEWEDGESTPRDFEDAVTGALTSQATDKHRRVKCTLTVKQGTPAASPTYPTLDAGTVAIAGIVVPATWTSGTAAAPIVDDSADPNSLVIHDQRMPLGTPRSYISLVRDMLFDVTTWSPDAMYRAATGNPGDGDLWIPLRTGSGGGMRSGMGRVVAIEYDGISTATGMAPSLARWTTTNTGVQGYTTLADLSSVIAAGASIMQDRKQFESEHQPAAGPTIIQNAAGMGPPIWANGRRALMPNSGFQLDDWSTLIMRFNEPATGFVTVHRGIFFVAEGL